MATATLIQPGEVVRAARGLLLADDFFASEKALGNGQPVADRLFLHSEDENEDGQKPSHYGVVMQEKPRGGTLATATGSRSVTVLVRWECPLTQPDHDIWHGQMQQHTVDDIDEQIPDGLTTSRPGSAFEQTRFHDTPMWDPGDRTWYSLTGFTIKLHPLNQ